jgi:hypothetical protein
VSLFFPFRRGASSTMVQQASFFRTVYRMPLSRPEQNRFRAGHYASVVSCLPAARLFISLAPSPGSRPASCSVSKHLVTAFSHVDIAEALQAIQGFTKDGAASGAGHTLAGKSRTLPHTSKVPSSCVPYALSIHLFAYYRVSLAVLYTYARSPAREHRRWSSLLQS